MDFQFDRVQCMHWLQLCVDLDCALVGHMTDSIYRTRCAQFVRVVSPHHLSNLRVPPHNSLQADSWKAVFGRWPLPMYWPSLLYVVSRLLISSRHLEGSLRSWNSSPTSTDALAFPAFNQAATSPLSYVVSRLLMLLKQTPGRQCSVLELLPNLD